MSTYTCVMCMQKTPWNYYRGPQTWFSQFGAFCKKCAKKLAEEGN